MDSIEGAPDLLVKLWISFAIYMYLRVTGEKTTSQFASMTSEEIIEIKFMY